LQKQLTKLDFSMQPPLQNDVERQPSSTHPVTERGNYDVLQAARQRESQQAARSSLEQYFASTAPVEQAPIETEVSADVQAAIPEQAPRDMREIYRYTKQLSEFIRYEREEMIKNGKRV
jgi:hypothetical protein